MMKLVIIAMLSAILCPAQVFTARALGSVTSARASAGAGDNSGVRKWLDQAERECPTSWAVMQEISKVYSLLGDATRAGMYERQARTLAPKDQGAVVTERNIES